MPVNFLQEQVEQEPDRGADGLRDAEAATLTRRAVGAHPTPDASLMTWLDWAMAQQPLSRELLKTLHQDASVKHLAGAARSLQIAGVAQRLALLGLPG